MGHTKAVLVQEAVDPVLHLGPSLHKLHPVAEELTSAPLLLIGDVAGGEHVSPEQSDQDSGVHFVRFHLRLCDEPCLIGVGENDVEAVFLEPVVDLDPQVSRGLYDGLHLVPE